MSECQRLGRTSSLLSFHFMAFSQTSPTWDSVYYFIDFMMKRSGQQDQAYLVFIYQYLWRAHYSPCTRGAGDTVMNNRYKPVLANLPVYWSSQLLEFLSEF